MKRLLATFALILIAACSGDDGTAPKNNDDDDDDGGGGTVTHEDSVRVQALNEIAQRLDGWWSEGPDTVAARAVAYLNTIPLFEEVGRDGPTGVWARFEDGRLLIIPNNLQQGASEDTLALFSGESRIASAPAQAARTRIIGAGRKALRSLRVPTKGLEIPKSKQFRVWDGIGGCFLTPKNRIRALLRNGGYTEAPASSPTVDGFMKVRGDGVFVLFTHGAPGQLKDKSYVYAMWTSTNVAIPEEGLYADLFDKQELAYIIEQGRNSIGGCSTGTNYGITSSFVSNHMSFAQNSLVYLNVCMSGTEGAGDFRQAFGNAGASVVVGWDGNVSVGETFKTVPYMIDRLLGANEVEPKEDPKQRAFNIYDVRENMEAVGRVTDPITGAVLKVFQVGGDFGLLAPTIQFLSIEENGLRGRMFIAGLFGTDPGEANRSVTINDQPVANIDWYSTEIDCDIPDAGSNASGTVVVKIGTGQNARESNPVNITEWKGDLIYDRDDPGSHTAQMTLTVRFRADIHDFRDKPGEPPFKTQVLFTASDDSKIAITSGGVFSETIADCTDTYTLGNNGSVKSPFVAGTDGSWIYFGSVDTQSHKLRLIMQVLAVWKAGTWKQSGDCENFEKPLYAQLAIEDCLFDDLNQTTAFSMDMNNDFEVLAGQRGPCSVDPMVSNLSGDYDGQAKIRWNDITPFFLPDPDAAR